MNRCRLARDLDHQRDHRYDPPELAIGKSWSAKTICAWISTEGGEVNDALSQLINHEGGWGISEVVAKGRATDVQALSTSDGDE